MRLLTAAEMREADNSATQKYGIPSIVLMENAALAVIHVIEKRLGAIGGKRIAVFCGGGNNGGDGLAVARHLFNRGATVRVFMLADADALHGDAAANYAILQNLGVQIRQVESERQMSILRLALINCDAVIDALLGTGLNGIVSSLYRAVIDVVNNSSSIIISVDIPSGLDADNGTIHGACIEAAATVSFAYAKLGMVLPQARKYVGELIIADISMPQEVLTDIGAQRRELVTGDFCHRFLPPRKSDSHKGDYGTLLIAAGSADMPGAASLAALSAFRSGCGRVQAALPYAVRPAFAANVKEATMLPLAPENADILQSGVAESLKQADGSALVLGMGIGRSSETQKCVKEILDECRLPAVVDADALFALSKEKNFVRSLPQSLIFTPHEGEFARLCGKEAAFIHENRFALAKDFAAEWGVILVLKGSGTVIATPDGRIFLNPTGNAGLATAGSGDVLSGIIGALLAQKLPPAAAAAVGVWLHGAAGDKAAAALGEYSLTAGDIVEFLPAVLKEI